MAVEYLRRGRDIEQPLPLEVPGEAMELTPDIFSENSFGRKYFPSELTGRRRPKATVDGWLNSDVDTIVGILTRRQLRDAGINTISDLFSLTPEELPPTHYKLKYFIERVQSAWNSRVDAWVMTPHGVLMGTIFGNLQGPVPANMEGHLARALDEAVSKLDEREQVIIKARFGLEDWNRMFLEEVGDELVNLTKERVRQIEARVFSKLRHAPHVASLFPWRTFPKGSIARKAGLVFLDEVPGFTTLADLRLSPEAMEDISEHATSVAARIDPDRVSLVDGLSGRIYRRNELKEETVQDIQARLGILNRRGPKPEEVFEGILKDFLPSEDEDDQIDNPLRVIENTRLVDMGFTHDTLSQLRQSGFRTFGDLMRYIKRDERVYSQSGSLFLLPSVVEEVSRRMLILSAYLELL